MNKIIRQGAFALSLLAGAALVSAPAFANSIHDNGRFGGSWSRIGPSHHHDRYARNFYRNYDRGYYRGYYGSGPYASYGPSYYDYGYAPSYYGYGPGFIGGPGVGFSIGID